MFTPCFSVLCFFFQSFDLHARIRFDSISHRVLWCPVFVAGLSKHSKNFSSDSALITWAKSVSRKPILSARPRRKPVLSARPRRKPVLSASSDISGLIQLSYSCCPGCRQ
ncbi:hypothetical protein GDO78_015793 [Eleutherodactylus coqui]|uniref:Uncharacterized protein n=1 Tax=Eleutherodactylus coqui TaxID=57060 RepID=A0A8J6B0M9_ELECQ|nr:hypothetical protein GDO78_015793 [Eleutherodactylus coqui]